MITTSKLNIVEGFLEETNPQIGSRRSQTIKNPPIMPHEKGEELMSEEVRDFRRAFYDMPKMVKVLYEE